MPPAVGDPRAISQTQIDEARLVLLRTRMRVFTSLLGVLLLVIASVQYYAVTHRAEPQTRPMFLVVWSTAAAGVGMILMTLVRRHRFAQSGLKSLQFRAMFLVVLSVVMQFAGASIIAGWIVDTLRPLGFTGHLGPGFPLLVFTLAVHLAACLTVPWTWVRALVPIAILTIIPAVLVGTGASGTRDDLLMVPLILLAGAPGVIISALRDSRFREMVGLRVISGRYAEMERDLAYARRVHERLFPAPITQGPVRLAFQYEPMRQIGGDYLDAVRGPTGATLVVLIDVTGHGIAAALAVNRLHGELKRLLAADAGAGPAQLLAGLNAYVALTLADEQIFATGLAVRIDPAAGTLTYANAGHPPMLVRRGATVEQFEPTGPMLGPFLPEEYQIEEARLTLTPADRVLAYTDGATEARSAAGLELDVRGVCEAFAEAPTDLDAMVAAVRARVDAHRAGPAEDDVLLVGLARA